jgi:hypothetical protein
LVEDTKAVEAIMRILRSRFQRAGRHVASEPALYRGNGLEEIWRKPKLTYADTKPTAGNPGPSWVCECAEEQDALYYACRHNKSAKNDTPILISFDAEASDAVVDGRDFLYTAFQLSDATRARAVLERMFGPAILRYADRAWGVDGDQRIALCDLAVQDDAVVRAHAANKTVIAGRFGTQFRSAFLVQTPVPAARIADVRVVEDSYELPEPEVILASLIQSVGGLDTAIKASGPADLPRRNLYARVLTGRLPKEVRSMSERPRRLNLSRRIKWLDWCRKRDSNPRPHHYE